MMHFHGGSITSTVSALITLPPNASFALPAVTGPAAVVHSCWLDGMEIKPEGCTPNRVKITTISALTPGCHRW